MGTITRYNDGNVTVILDGALEDFVRRAVEAANVGVLELMEGAAGEVRDQANASWYGPTGVQKDTGASGDIQVITTISADEVRVSVGSTDTKLVKLPSGRMVPRAVVIHRPGRLALEKKLVSQEEWGQWKRRGLPTAYRGTVGKDDWTIMVPSSEASDGKYLVQEFIRAPMRAKITAITPELGKIIASKLRKGGA